MNSYEAFQKLHPASLLAQMVSSSTSGCLQASNKSTSWLIHLDNGKLIFATNSDKAFERLDRHLYQLSHQVPVLIAAVRIQVRLLFELSLEIRPAVSADYRAIHWLVEQQYLNLKQVAVLVEGIAREVLESFLSLTEASYKLIEKETFANYPKLCQFDIYPFIKRCQNKANQQQATTSLPLSKSLYSGEIEQQNHRLSAIDSPKKSPRYTQSNDALESSKSRYKIVCIDDSQTILQTIKTFLDDASFTVIMIDNPIKALMQVIRSNPDIILLDVGMPNLDGYELCSLLRKHTKFKHLPIIMVTGNTGFIDRAKAKLAGASGYLTKPFTQSELLKTVFKHLA